jgi:hypothetical protein
MPVNAKNRSTRVSALLEKVYRVFIHVCRLRPRRAVVDTVFEIRLNERYRNCCPINSSTVTRCASASLITRMASRGLNQYSLPRTCASSLYFSRMLLFPAGEHFCSSSYPNGSPPQIGQPTTAVIRMADSGDELPYLAQTWNGTNAHHSCRFGRPSDESVHRQFC